LYQSIAAHEIQPKSTGHWQATK